jgi:hypothetical protein
MTTTIKRREFLKSVPAAAFAASSFNVPDFFSPHNAEGGRIFLEPFNYEGVKLRESRWLEQYKAAREVYYDISDDDILKGYREAAGLPAPGTTLGGWCRRNSNTVLGQWLSGMSRMYKATGDDDMRKKAVRLVTEFAKTVKPDGDCGMRHYAFDKLVCGLVDLKLYAGYDDAIPMLEKVTDFAIKNFSRENVAAVPGQIYQGRPSEWYTLSENLYRAYQLTGKEKFKDFGDVWLYHSFWNKFADTSSPTDAYGVHAYSHVNTFCSAAMAYGVTGNDKYLRILKNAYDYLQQTQCYATGGFGSREQLAAPGKGLLRMLELRYDSFEAVCGSWAGFKMSRYLTQFTGESRYGDWMERLFYNGIGAALWFAPKGRNFYYADYRLASGMKAYNWDAFTCCSGTYIQDVADFHNIIYYKDASGVFVNLYIPSEVTWKSAEGEVKLVQDTQYPESEISTITVSVKKRMTFSLRFRIPEWARGATITVNGSASKIGCTPGAWAEVKRTWNSGDRVELRIPLSFRMQTLETGNPQVKAIVRGPVVMVLENDFHEPAFRLPQADSELTAWMVPDTPQGTYRVQVSSGERVRSKIRPFYDLQEGYPYLMYFDTTKLPSSLQ